MITCNDAGTSSDPVDDFIEFSLNPTGDNVGAGYTISVSAGTVNPTAGTYGASTSFTLNAGSAGGGNVVVTITDDTDLSCQLTDMIADPGSCSDDCLLTGAGLSGVDCDSNGTPDETDDMIVFSLNPTGTGLSSGYTVTVTAGTVTPDNASYGSATAFTMNPGSAGSGGVVVTITDMADTTCMIMATVADPGPCSVLPCEVDACDISTESMTTICLDDVPDTIQVICHPGTIGMNVGWVLTDTTGIILSLPSLADTADFVFEGLIPGDYTIVCLIQRIVWDGTLTGLSVDENINSLGGCYDLSNPITVTKQSGTDCVSSVYNPELDALINVYPIPTSGTLHIATTALTIHRVKIVDIIGRTVHQIDETNPTEVDVRAMESGLYYMILETDRGQSLKKVVIGK
jgi:hypothetical protein